MIRLEPDLHDCGFAYLPIHAVTACFQTDRDIDTLIRELTAAGVANDRVETFTGGEPVNVLDPRRWLNGVWMRYRRDLGVSILAEFEAIARAEQVHQAGGRSVAVFVQGAESRQQVAGILKARGGQDVVYWGGLVNEKI